MALHIYGSSSNAHAVVARTCIGYRFVVVASETRGIENHSKFIIKDLPFFSLR